MRAQSLGLFLAIALTGTAALADEVRLKNGDRITGKVLSAEGGSLIVAPDFAKGSKITLSMADVETFSTTAPLVLRLKNGTELHQAVAGDVGGKIALASGGPVAPQTIGLTDVDKINPAAVAWHGGVGLNGSVSQAATNATQIGLSFDGVRRSDTDRLAFNGAYSYGDQSSKGRSTVNSDNWAAALQYDFFLLPKVYASARAGAAGDHVNHLSLRFTPSLNGGYQWIDKGDFHVSTEFGFAWNYEDYATQPRANENASVRLAYHVDKSLDGGRISLFHSLEYLPSVQNTSEFLVNTDAGMRVNLTSNMYSELKAKLAYDAQPPAGAKATTSEIRVGVGLSY